MADPSSNDDPFSGVSDMAGKAFVRASATHDKIPENVPGRAQMYATLQLADRLIGGGQHGMAHQILEGLNAAMEQTVALRAKNRSLQLTSIQDRLTGLPDRAGIMRYLENHVSKMECKNHAGVLSSDTRSVVVFVDLKDFKSVNDTYGAQYGDALLCAIADTLRENRRPDDFVGRLGGDEFIVVLNDIDPNAPIDGNNTALDVVLERLHYAVGRASINIYGQKLSRDAHIGFEVIEPDASFKNVASIIQRADKNRLEKKRIAAADAIEHPDLT